MPTVSSSSSHNTRGHKRLRRNAASAGSIATTTLGDAHSVDIVYSKSAKGEGYDREFILSRSVMCLC